MVDTTGGILFARLLYTFTFSLTKDSEKLAMALILPYDASITLAQRRRDSDLGLYRVSAKANPCPEIIFARSIIRGTLLVPDFSKPLSSLNFYVFDVLDSDMFLRKGELHNSLE